MRSSVSCGSMWISVAPWRSASAMIRFTNLTMEASSPSAPTSIFEMEPSSSSTA